MTHFEVSTSVAERLRELSAQMDLSVNDLLRWLLDQHETVQESEPPVGDDQFWTAEEIAEVMRPKEPLTGQQMVERGLIGGWEDMDAPGADEP